MLFAHFIAIIIMCVMPSCWFKIRKYSLIATNKCIPSQYFVTEQNAAALAAERTLVMRWKSMRAFIGWRKLKPTTYVVRVSALQ